VMKRVDIATIAGLATAFSINKNIKVYFDV